ncbi:acetate--CoA ligase family protein [Alicyclobacillus dauci]|uniref:Acetate--CoA ligase family protein n=1 Tax=Alicyclobacillus dauci TaxID=1475485 RepID=A0ABY6Z3M1_9BACL|nr:acetate--CoA ligase family protein [Alicyclobacillus dauci]WAH37489.1 acetate--CoA ligase family protein [Alicyclobacillus dauci]
MNDLTSPERLRQFFHPQSIALVGATDKSRWSLFTYMNLKTFGGSGGATVHCVHPKHEVVHGQKAVPSLLDIDEPVDLAYVMVPTGQVLQVLRDADAADIRNLVILTSGFSEIGPEGAAMEREVLEFARAHNQLLLGPNGNGFINVTAQLTPYGLLVAPPLTPGPVGIVLQSGALASTVLTLAQARNVGLSLLVSMGNETMMSATDVMDYLIEDEATKVLAVFLESIRQPKEFARIAKKALEHGKPIVAMKIGRSEHSARTAMAHTGALVGDDAVNDAAFRQLGVIRVNSLEDLITTAGLLGYTPPLTGRRMGVVTPSGGACDILSDRAADEGILLPEFAPETVSKLKEVVPSFSTIHNPLDVTGFVVVDGTLLRRALAVVADDPGFDFLLCLTDPPRIEPDDVAPVIEQYSQLHEVVARAKVPIVVVSNSSIDITPFGRSVLEKLNLHFVGGMEHGMSALGKAVWWHQKYRESRLKNKAFEEVSRPSTSLSTGEWSEHAARAFLDAEGIPVVPGVLARTAVEAVEGANAVGYPVVLKIQSADIQHKSDVGGVALGLQSDEEVLQAYQTILASVREKVPRSRVDGILVSPMRGEGVEMLVGVVRDALWGQVLAVGMGGVFVEVMKDTSLRVLPVDRAEIRSMLEELRSFPLLRGTRGRIGADIERLVDVIYQISRLAVRHRDQLRALEINPLWIHGSQIEALDALISIEG